MFFSRGPHWLEVALTWVPALVLAAISIRLWRRYWSMRFWLGAAVLYWLIPWGSRAIFNAGNGAGIRSRSVPAAVVEPFYKLAEFSWLLLALLMGIGLLSFHPATRWVDTARYRNVVVAGFLLLLALPLSWVSYRASEHRVVPPLNPSEYHKDRKFTDALTVTWEPRAEVMPPDAAGFRIVLTNTGGTDIHLNELPIGSVRFRPEPFFTCRRANGQLTEWGQGVKISNDEELLSRSESRTFDVEVPVMPNPSEPESDSYLSYLSAGDYTAFVTFVLQKGHAFEKTVSNVITFRITGPHHE